MSMNAPPPAHEDRPQLDYPFETPASGRSIEVGPGVHWIRMPLPFALDHINVWALADDDGWAIVDTGICSDATAAAWHELFAAEIGPGPVRRVFVTHMHPDHVGMAGWLTRKFECRLWMTRLEYLQCRVLVSDTGREAPAEGETFYRQAGWSPSAIEAYRARFGSFGKQIHALPDSYRRMVDGEQIDIGGQRWEVIVGLGHSPEHACLYSPGLKLLVAGDQVLPRISSNISVHATEPDADPMADWYASMARLKQRVPDDVLVLPAHNDCFRGLHARLDYLLRDQDRALDRLREALREPRRAVDVFTELFSRPVHESAIPIFSMATGESLACLNHLVAGGVARRDLDPEGVAWYRLNS